MSLALSAAAAAAARESGSPEAPANSGPNCLDRLDRLGMDYSGAPRRRGVARPVAVRLPLNGISYYAAGSLDPQSRLFMDCRLALALHGMGKTLKARGIDAVEHFGVYAFRCIAGTDPCKLSQHARATAIDLHEFRSRDGRTYNVETDWVVDSFLNIEAFAEPTCTAATASPKDAFLHELACQWSEAGLFHIVLTPNYNADHRNHFHVDLTPGERYIN